MAAIIGLFLAFGALAIAVGLLYVVIALLVEYWQADADERKRLKTQREVFYKNIADWRNR